MQKKVAHDFRYDPRTYNFSPTVYESKVQGVLAIMLVQIASRTKIYKHLSFHCTLWQFLDHAEDKGKFTHVNRSIERKVGYGSTDKAACTLRLVSRRQAVRFVLISEPRKCSRKFHGPPKDVPNRKVKKVLGTHRNSDFSHPSLSQSL